MAFRKNPSTGAALAATSAVALTPVKPYVVSLDSNPEVTAILSVGDTMPNTDDPTRAYQMVGIPDGMGAHPNADGTHSLYLSYELTGPTLAEPNVGGALQRGAYASIYTVDGDGNVLSGKRAFEEVYFENSFVGPIAEVGNATPALNRLCSASLARPNVGFDRWTYLEGEELEGATTLDGRGGVGVAIFDGEAHVLPRLGRCAKEDLLVMRGKGRQTIIMGMEDGPSTPDSQLWMCVGVKDRSARGNVLRRNGLDNGRLYVLRTLDASKKTEGDFRSGVVACEWVEIPNAHLMTDGVLEVAADAVGAFGFVRVEDGAFHPAEKDEFFFATTGSSWTPAGAAQPANKLGRLCGLKLDKTDVTAPCELQVVYNADDIIAAGGDVAISPDNMDLSATALVIQDDGTSESRPVMASKGRDGSIWSFPLTGLGWQQRVNVAGRSRVAELDPPGRDGVPVGPGVWESSGIIDAAGVLGDGSWIVNVQAHRPTVMPVINTVEDGQVLWIHPLRSRGKRKHATMARPPRHFIGIDFGTSNCSVSCVVDEDGLAQRRLVQALSVQFERDGRPSSRMPSIVAADLDAAEGLVPAVHVGGQFLEQLRPDGPAVKLLRRGRDYFTSVKSQLGEFRVLPHSLVAGMDSPADVARRIFVELAAATARAHPGLDLREGHVVITVPASFCALARSQGHHRRRCGRRTRPLADRAARRTHRGARRSPHGSGRLHGPPA